MILLVGGCSSKSAIDWEKEGDPFEKIKIEIISQSETNEGTVVEIGIHNETNHDIVDMNVALSYPIIRENGSTSNKERVNADNTLDVIEAGSIGIVKVLIPSSYGYERNWDAENPEIHIEGYFEKKSDVNSFGISGPIKAYLIDNP
jgi:uncharacterized protein YceK